MAGRAAAAKNGHQPVALRELLALPLPYEDVSLPEMGQGVSVRLTAITGLQRAELAAKLPNDDNDRPGYLAWQIALVAACMDADTDEVGRLPGSVIDRLSTVATRLSSADRQAVARAESALKATPSGDSG